MTRLHLCALAVTASVLAASGCGAAESQPSAERADATATAVSVAPVSDGDVVDDTATTTATTPIATEGDDCEFDRTMLELAVEAYVERTGRLATSQDDLVGEYLRVEITSHRLDPDGRVTRLGRVPCVLPEPSTDPPRLSNVDLRSVDEWLWFLGDEFVDDAGGLDCATEVARILVAATAFEEREGREPVDRADHPRSVVPILSGLVKSGTVSFRSGPYRGDPSVHTRCGSGGGAGGPCRSRPGPARPRCTGGSRRWPRQHSQLTVQRSRPAPWRAGP